MSATFSPIRYQLINQLWHGKVKSKKKKSRKFSVYRLSQKNETFLAPIQMFRHLSIRNSQTSVFFSLFFFGSFSLRYIQVFDAHHRQSSHSRKMRCSPFRDKQHNYRRKLYKLYSHIMQTKCIQPEQVYSTIKMQSEKKNRNNEEAKNSNLSLHTIRIRMCFPQHSESITTLSSPNVLGSRKIRFSLRHTVLAH